MEEIQSNFDTSGNILSTFTNPVTASSGWINDFVYGAGYIKSIHVRLNNPSSSSGISFYIFDLTGKIIYKRFLATTNDVEQDLELNLCIKERFRVGTYSNSHIMYRNLNSIYKSYMFPYNTSIGDIPTKTEYGKYDFSFYLKYEKYDEYIANIFRYGDLKEFTLNDMNIFDFTNTSALGGFWASSNTYDAGYVENIIVRRIPNSSYTKLVIIDSIENKVLSITTNNTDDVHHINQYIKNPFYCYALGAYYSTWNDGDGKYQFVTGINAFDSYTIGSPFTPSFSNGTYIFSIKVTYKNIISGNMEFKIKQKPKLFVCGDSITAGYPYYSGNPSIQNEDLRWGNVLARRLGYDITFGAQSGNGWLYSTGSTNAYSITNDTDFSLYDAAIYFWGTNDYGHSSALGTPTDTTSDLTVCGRVRYCINKIYNDNSHIVFAIVLPLNRSTDGTFDNNYAYGTPNSGGYTLNQLCDAIKSVCESEGVICIDPRMSPFNRRSIPYLTTDGLHPNIKGYELLGSFITGQFGSYTTPYYTAELTESNI